MPLAIQPTSKVAADTILEKNNLEPMVKQELTDINEGLLDVIHEIRETCNELMPPFLRETGIVGALENLFKNVQLRTNIVVDFVFESNSNNSINDETILILYRVVQELMNNAEKHSNASKVHISLSNDIDYLLLKYRDNGNGFDLENQSRFKGRFGIYGIKERIRSVNGKINFYSNENGLEVLIKIPVEKDSEIFVGQ